MSDLSEEFDDEAGEDFEDGADLAEWGPLPSDDEVLYIRALFAAMAKRSGRDTAITLMGACVREVLANDAAGHGAAPQETDIIRAAAFDFVERELNERCLEIEMQRAERDRLPAESAGPAIGFVI